MSENIPALRVKMAVNRRRVILRYMVFLQWLVDAALGRTCIPITVDA